jgi:hypothetical protein
MSLPQSRFFCGAFCAQTNPKPTNRFPSAVFGVTFWIIARAGPAQTRLAVELRAKNASTEIKYHFCFLLVQFFIRFILWILRVADGSAVSIGLIE